MIVSLHTTRMLCCVPAGITLRFCLAASAACRLGLPCFSSRHLSLIRLSEPNPSTASFTQRACKLAQVQILHVLTQGVSAATAYALAAVIMGVQTDTATATAADAKTPWNPT